MPGIAATPPQLEITRLLHALADPVRFDVVCQLRSADAPIACGHFETTVTKSTLSHHLKILREAGVLVTRRDGGRSVNTLREREIEAAFPGLLDAILPGGGRASSAPPRRARG